jgi:hypothetical protein
MVGAWQVGCESVQLLDLRKELWWWQISWSSDAKVDILLVLFGGIFLKDVSHPKHPYHLKGVQVVV